MKIVHILPSLKKAGAEVFVSNLAVEMAKCHEVTVLALHDGVDENEMKDYLCSNNVNVINLHSSSGIIRVLKLNKVLDKMKPDIINTHLERVSFYFVVCNLSRKWKSVQTIHNTVIDFPNLQRLVMKHFFDGYIAISEKTKSIIYDQIKPNSCEKIYNGTTLDRFKCKRDINIRPKIVLFIGRFEEQKNHKFFVESYKKIIDDGFDDLPDVYFAGEGSMMNGIQKYCTDNDLNERVHFLGIRNDIPELLEDSDILVNTSKWEGLSIALIEGCASGIPMLVSDVGSNGEIITDEVSGFVYKDGDYIDFKNKFLRLCNDAELRKKFSDISKSEAAKFSIKTSAKNYIEYYLQV